MGYHEEKQSANYWIPEGEEREKGTESLFKETVTKTSQVWGEICTSKFMKHIVPETNLIKRDLLQDTL